MQVYTFQVCPVQFLVYPQNIPDFLSVINSDLLSHVLESDEPG